MNFSFSPTEGTRNAMSRLLPLLEEHVQDTGIRTNIGSLFHQLAQLQPDVFFARLDQCKPTVRGRVKDYFGLEPPEHTEAKEPKRPPTPVRRPETARPQRKPETASNLARLKKPSAARPGSAQGRRASCAVTATAPQADVTPPIPSTPTAIPRPQPVSAPSTPMWETGTPMGIEVVSAMHTPRSSLRPLTAYPNIQRDELEAVAALADGVPVPETPAARTPAPPTLHHVRPVAATPLLRTVLAPRLEVERSTPRLGPSSLDDLPCNAIGMSMESRESPCKPAELTQDLSVAFAGDTPSGKAIFNDIGDHIVDVEGRLVAEELVRSLWNKLDELTLHHKTDVFVDAADDISGGWECLRLQSFGAAKPCSDHVHDLNQNNPCDNPSSSGGSFGGAQSVLCGKQGFAFIADSQVTVHVAFLDRVMEVEAMDGAARQEHQYASR